MLEKAQNRSSLKETSGFSFQNVGSTPYLQLFTELIGRHTCVFFEQSWKIGKIVHMCIYLFAQERI